MDFFRDLGLAILDAWQRADFDGRAFADIAANALRQSPPSAHVDPMDVIHWVLKAPTLVDQADVDSKFAEPAISVFSCERFYIEVLFWVDTTTAIHEHGFSGAFHVMEGSSMQSTYRFTPTRRYCDQLMSGKLDLLGVELLTKGNVRAFRSGPEFIHSLFHLHRPSVSVVVRTHSDAFAGPQYDYSHAGFAVDPFFKSESMAKKIQTLDLLHGLRHPEFESLARDAVIRADSFLAFKLLRHLKKCIVPDDRYAGFRESIRPAHGDLVDRLTSFETANRRDEHIALSRQRATQWEHRFLLALLLSVPDRPRIIELVRQASPGQEPIATIVQWLAQLSKIDVVEAWVADVANVPALESARILDVRIDEVSLRILAHLLEGATDHLVVSRLRESSESDVAPVQPAEVIERCAALRRSMLLRPLFVP